MSRAGFEPGIFDSLLLEFAVAHKPTQPPRPNENDSFYLHHFNVEDLMGNHESGTYFKALSPCPAFVGFVW